MPAFRLPRDAMSVIFIRYVTPEKRDNGKNWRFRALFLLEKRISARYIMGETDSLHLESASKQRRFHQPGFPSIKPTTKVNL
jgi:hypothetical protein